MSEEQSWADKTFWVKVERGDEIYYQAVVSDDVDGTVLGFAGKGEAITAIKARRFDGCRKCTYIEDCMDSVWNEGRRMGGPSNDTRECRISMVHTCHTCAEKTITDYADKRIRRIVPDTCPRWNALSGSALDCDGCQAEKQTLKELHPSYVKFAETAVDDWQEFCTLIQSGDDLAKRRNAQSLACKWSEASLPEFPKFDQPQLIRAQWVCGALLEDIRTRFRKEWLGLKAHHMNGMILNWLERVYVSLGRHPEDPEALVHEFILLFNDRNPFRSVWAKMVLPRRKFLTRIWVGLARSVWSQCEALESE